MTENKPLIIPELVALDADAGPGKEDVIEFLATTVAGAGRASSPDGLAADASSDAAVAQIFAAKGRPSDHPLIVHVADAQAAYDTAENDFLNARQYYWAYQDGDDSTYEQSQDRDGAISAVDSALANATGYTEPAAMTAARQALRQAATANEAAQKALIDALGSGSDATQPQAAADAAAQEYVRALNTFTLLLTAADGEEIPAVSLDDPAAAADAVARAQLDVDGAQVRVTWADADYYLALNGRETTSLALDNATRALGTASAALSIAQDALAAANATPSPVSPAPTAADLAASQRTVIADQTKAIAAADALVTASSPAQWPDNPNWDVDWADFHNAIEMDSRPAAAAAAEALATAEASGDAAAISAARADLIAKNADLLKDIEAFADFLSDAGTASNATSQSAAWVAADTALAQSVTALRAAGGQAPSGLTAPEAAAQYSQALAAQATAQSKRDAAEATAELEAYLERTPAAESRRGSTIVGDPDEVAARYAELLATRVLYYAMWRQQIGERPVPPDA